jgi:ADP-heptose:LPS heptosyltransferase
MHLAEALKKKVVAIFGSTSEELGFFPYTTQYTVVQNENLKCRPCSHIGRKKCPKGHFKCMKEISADDAIKAIEELLRKSPNLDKPEPKIKNLIDGIGMTWN